MPQPAGSTIGVCSDGPPAADVKAPLSQAAGSLSPSLPSAVGATSASAAAGVGVASAPSEKKSMPAPPLDWMHLSSDERRAVDRAARDDLVARCGGGMQHEFKKGDWLVFYQGKYRRRLDPALDLLNAIAQIPQVIRDDIFLHCWDQDPVNIYSVNPA